MADFDELVAGMSNEDGEKAIEECTEESGASYLQKHLLDIQSYLHDEIAQRKAISSFLGLLLAQSANYAFSLVLISSGAEFFSSTLIGLIIGLMPGIADMSHINQTPNQPLEKYLPVAVKTAIALFSTGIILTQVTLPHMASRQELNKIYADIEFIERGRPSSSVLDNLKNSPLTPIALILLVYTGLQMALSQEK